MTVKDYYLVFTDDSEEIKIQAIYCHVKEADKQVKWLYAEGCFAWIEKWNFDGFDTMRKIY